MAEHTPGPWKYKIVNDEFILSNVDADSDAEGRMQDYGSSILEGGLVLENDAENEANARLIAAAPDLLAALEGLLKAANEGERSWWHAERVARAAIAKARNREIPDAH